MANKKNNSSGIFDLGDVEAIKGITKENIVDMVKANLQEHIEANEPVMVEQPVIVEADITTEAPEEIQAKTDEAKEEIKKNVSKSLSSEQKEQILYTIETQSKIKEINKTTHEDKKKAFNDKVAEGWDKQQPIPNAQLKKRIESLQTEHKKATIYLNETFDSFDQINKLISEYPDLQETDPKLFQKLMEASEKAEKRLIEAYYNAKELDSYIVSITDVIMQMKSLGKNIDKNVLAQSNLLFSQVFTQDENFNSSVVRSNPQTQNFMLKELGVGQIVSTSSYSKADVYTNKIDALLGSIDTNKHELSKLEDIPENADKIKQLTEQNRKQWLEIVQLTGQLRLFLKGSFESYISQTKRSGVFARITSGNFADTLNYTLKTNDTVTGTSSEENTPLTKTASRFNLGSILSTLGKGDGKDSGLISNLMLLCKYAEEASIDLLDLSKAKDAYNSSDDKEGFLNNVINVLKILEQIKLSISDINTIYKELPTNSSEKDMLEAAGTIDSQGKYSFAGKFNKTKSEKPFSGFISSTPASRENIQKNLYSLLQEIVPDRFQDIKAEVKHFNLSDDEGLKSELLKYFDQERSTANTMNEAASSFASSAQILYDKAHSFDDNEYTKYAYNKNNSEEINKKNKEALQKSGRNLISRYLDLDSFESIYKFDEKRTEQEQNDFIETYILNLNKLYKILELLKGHKATIDNLSNAGLWNGSFKSDGSISLDDKISISREDKNNNNIASYIRTFYSNAGIEVDKSQVENSNRKKINVLGVAAVQDKEITKVQTENEQLQAQNEKLRNQVEELKQSNRVLSEIVENKGDKSDRLQEKNSSLQQDINNLTRDVNEANDKIAQLQERLDNVDTKNNQRDSETKSGASSENNKTKGKKSSKRSKSELKTTETTNENAEIEAVKTEGDIVEKTVDQETQKFKSLENSITGVTKAISEKTNTVIEEDKTVSEVVQKEIDNFQKLEDKVKDVTDQINNINGPDTNNSGQFSENKPEKKRKKYKKKDTSSDNNSNNGNLGETNNSGEEKRLILDLNEIKPDLQEKVGKLLNDYVDNLLLDENKSIKSIKVKNSEKGVTGTLTYSAKDQKDGKIITKTLEQNFEILETAIATASKNVSDFAQEIADGNYVLRVKNETATITYGKEISTDNKNQNKKNENQLESLIKKLDKVEKNINSSKIDKQDAERLLGSSGGSNENYTVTEIRNKIDNLNSNPDQVTKTDLDDIEKLIESLKNELANSEQAVKDSEKTPTQIDKDIYNEKWENRSLNLSKLKDGLKSIGKYDPTDNTAEAQAVVKDLEELENLLNNNKDAYDSDVFTKFDAMLKTFNTKYLSETTKKQQNDIEKVNKDIDDTRKRINEIKDKINAKSNAGTISEQDATQLKNSLKPDKNQLINSLNEEDKTKESVKNNKNLILKEDFVLNIKNLDQTKQNLKSINDELDKVENNLTDIKTKSDLINKYTNLSRKVQNFYDANSNLKSNKELNNRVTNLINQLNNAIKNDKYGYSKEEIDKLQKEFDNIRFDTKDLDLTGKNFADSFKQKFSEVVLKNIGNLAAGAIGNYFRQMVNNVKEIDAAMTELKKVTNETSTTYNNFLKEAGTRASALGSTMTDLISSTADFAKLGYSVKEAAVLAENAIMYSNVGDLDIQTATSDIVSALKAFDIEASNAIKIVDSFNEVGNNYAISAQQIGEALQNSASSLVVAGNDIDQSIAMITAMTEITQDAASAGAALRTLSLRIRGKHNVPPYKKTYMLCLLHR